LHRRATPAAVPETRHAIKSWLAENGIAGPDAGDILLATTEACANVVTHAYGLAEGSLDVTASLTDSEVSIVVGDDGVWLTPAAARTDNAGGHGLSIMRKLMDHVEIVTTRGTEVRMRRRLNGARDG